MSPFPSTRKAPVRRAARIVAARCVALAAWTVAFPDWAMAQEKNPPTMAPIVAPIRPTRDYWVYVGAESADKLHRVRFGPAGVAVERTIEVGELAAEMEGPHGLVISADAKFLYMTTGHGSPDGKLWRYALGPDTLVGPGIFLGNFPASIDVTPDGLYTFSANFNLHGDMIPSTVSVVYTQNNSEIARIVTCTMPHGSRIAPDGAHQYSACMMDDQLVEIDTRTFEVSRRFSLAKGKEAPLAIDNMGAMSGGMAGMDHVTHDRNRVAAATSPKPTPDRRLIRHRRAVPRWASRSTPWNPIAARRRGHSHRLMVRVCLSRATRRMKFSRSIRSRGCWYGV